MSQSFDVRQSRNAERQQRSKFAEPSKRDKAIEEGANLLLLKIFRVHRLARLILWVLLFNSGLLFMALIKLRQVADQLSAISLR